MKKLSAAKLKRAKLNRDTFIAILKETGRKVSLGKWRSSKLKIKLESDGPLVLQPPLH